MKRTFLILAISILLIPVLKNTAFGRSLFNPGPVVSYDHGLNLDLWTNRDQDAIYGSGEILEVYFRANTDCYVSIYSIDTEGRTEMLFPRYPDDGYIFGGMTYRLPDYYADLDLRLRGPHGVGYLHAVASRTPRPFRITLRNGNYHLRLDRVNGDPFLAMNRIDDRLIHSHNIHATATTSYFVGKRVWYPRYMCYDCHGRRVRFDPYNDACPRYTVRVTHNYDYWWGYDYHPHVKRFAFGGPFWRFELRTVSVHRHHYRYVDCAIGYGNYRPMRPIYRPHTRVVYRSPRLKTRHGYSRSYTPVTYRETAVRRSGNTRTLGTRKSTRSTGATRNNGIRSGNSGTTRSATRSTSGTTRSATRSTSGTTRSATRSTSGTTRTSGVRRSAATSGSSTQASSRGLNRSSAASGSSASRTATTPAAPTSARERTARRDGTTAPTTSIRTRMPAGSNANRSVTTRNSSGSNRSSGVRTGTPSSSPRSTTRSTPSSTSSRRTTTFSRSSSSGDDNTRSSSGRSRSSRNSSRTR